MEIEGGCKKDETGDPTLVGLGVVVHSPCLKMCEEFIC